MRVVRAKQYAPILVALFLGAMSLLGGTAAANTVSVTLIAGPLSITNPTVAGAASVSLDGTAKSTSLPLDNLSVTDATGTGAGWHLTVQATPLSAAGRALPAGSLCLSYPNLDRLDGMCPGLVETAIGTCPIDTAVAVTVVSASPGDSGMGAFASQSPGALMVSVPADTRAGTYCATVIISLVSGP
jgi:hypothetical protein